MREGSALTTGVSFFSFVPAGKRHRARTPRPRRPPCSPWIRPAARSRRTWRACRPRSRADSQPWRSESPSALLLVWHCWLSASSHNPRCLVATHPCSIRVLAGARRSRARRCRSRQRLRRRSWLSLRPTTPSKHSSFCQLGVMLAPSAYRWCCRGKAEQQSELRTRQVHGGAEGRRQQGAQLTR